MKCAALAVLCLALTGCILQARLYNLKTGEVSDITLNDPNGTGHGRITGALASGEALSGDYTTFNHLPVNWGAIYRNIYGGFEGTDITAGQLKGLTAHQQYGTAVISGAKGFIADCEYVAASLHHGAGACKGGDGIVYKLIW